MNTYRKVGSECIENMDFVRWQIMCLDAFNMLFTYISVVINSSERKDERGGYDDGRKYVKKPWIGGFVHGQVLANVNSYLWLV